VEDRLFEPIAMEQAFHASGSLFFKNVTEKGLLLFREANTVG
jgi:hypothetical protein